jgi:hypothetical protein
MPAKSKPIRPSFYCTSPSSEAVNGLLLKIDGRIKKLKKRDGNYPDINWPVGFRNDIQQFLITFTFLPYPHGSLNVVSSASWLIYRPQVRLLPWLSLSLLSLSRQGHADPGH